MFAWMRVLAKKKNLHKRAIGITIALPTWSSLLFHFLDALANSMRYLDFFSCHQLCVGACEIDQMILMFMICKNFVSSLSRSLKRQKLVLKRFLKALATN